MGNIGAHYRDWRYIGPGKQNANFPLTGPHIGYGFNVQLYYTDKDSVLQTARDAVSTGCASRCHGRTSRV